MRVLARRLPDDKDPFLTVEEIAAVTRVSKMTVYRAIHNGDLDSSRIGRSFRVRESAYRKWLNLPASDEAEESERYGTGAMRQSQLQQP
jgi:excisionase family DNA binding protein